MGFRAPERPTFHPFFHEIIEVQQSPRPDDSIELVKEVWPALLLGNLMFCRAGCVVSGGTGHVVKGIAEHSRLYWTYRRKDRPCWDLSHGWGRNSQWRTQLRRDYQSPSGFHYNIDAKQSLNDAGNTIDGMDTGAMIELVRHRGLVRSSLDDSDLFPYLYSFFERG
jgi:hypothetical protein